jgi:hypothetical protein
MLGLTVALMAGVGSAAWAQAQGPSVTVGGLGYLQYGYQIQKDSVSNTRLNSFDVTRAYINVIGKLGHGVYVRFTTDISRSLSANQLTIREKYAYVAWTPGTSPLTFKLGEIHTPWLDWEEALWDYRVQGTMAIERAGYLSSSDFGAGIDGNWHYDKLNMQVGVYNGEGYGGAVGDGNKDIEGRASFKILNTDLPGRVGGLRATVYGHYGTPSSGGKRERYIGLLSYKSKMLTLAAEYAIAKDSVTGQPVPPPAPPATQTIATLTYRKGRIFSGYGTVNFPNTNFAIIGRVDITDPNDASAVTNDKLTRIIGGVSYQLSPNLRLLADVDNVTRQGGNYNNAFNSTRSTAYFQAQISF